MIDRIIGINCIIISTNNKGSSASDFLKFDKLGAPIDYLDILYLLYTHMDHQIIIQLIQIQGK